MKKIIDTIVALAGAYAVLYILLAVVQLGEFAAQIITEFLTF